MWVAGAAPRLAVAGMWGMAVAAAAAALVPLMVALLHFYCSSTEAKHIPLISPNLPRCAAPFYIQTHEIAPSPPPRLNIRGARRTSSGRRNWYLMFSPRSARSDPAGLPCLGERVYTSVTQRTAASDNNNSYFCWPASERRDARRRSC